VPLTEFVKTSADRQEALQELGESKLPLITSIALSLYNDPEGRRDAIAFSFLQDGYNRAVASGTSEEVAAEQWEQIAELVDMKLDDLASVPYDQRSDLEIIAMSIILAASKQQAEAESGLVMEAAKIGKESGDELKQITKGVTKKQLEGATFAIKDELAARKKAKS